MHFSFGAVKLELKAEVATQNCVKYCIPEYRFSENVQPLVNQKVFLTNFLGKDPTGDTDTISDNSLSNVRPKFVYTAPNQKRMISKLEL